MKKAISISIDENLIGEIKEKTENVSNFIDDAVRNALRKKETEEELEAYYKEIEDNMMSRQRILDDITVKLTRIRKKKLEDLEKEKERLEVQEEEELKKKTLEIIEIKKELEKEPEVLEKMVEQFEGAKTFVYDDYKEFNKIYQIAGHRVSLIAIKKYLENKELING